MGQIDKSGHESPSHPTCQISRKTCRHTYTQKLLLHKYISTHLYILCFFKEVLGSFLLLAEDPSIPPVIITYTCPYIPYKPIPILTYVYCIYKYLVVRVICTTFPGQPKRGANSEAFWTLKGFRGICHLKKAWKSGWQTEASDDQEQYHNSTHQFRFLKQIFKAVIKLLPPIIVSRSRRRRWLKYQIVVSNSMQNRKRLFRWRSNVPLSPGNYLVNRF